MTGKKVRWNRFLFRGTRRGLIVPIDHGLTIGPVSGLGSVREISRWIAHPAICGVIVHKGMAERLGEAGLLDGLGVMVHLNGMSSLSKSADSKERLTDIPSSVRLGADAVSFQVNFDGANDSKNLSQMGQIVDEASRYSLPVLAMVYDKVIADKKTKRDRLRHLIRVSIEMGCDAIKIAPPENVSELAPLLEGVAEDIPVFLAGGTITSVESLVEMTRAGLRAGLSGLCLGRNVFQREDSSEVLDQLRETLVPRFPRVTELPLTPGEILIWGSLIFMPT